MRMIPIACPDHWEQAEDREQEGPLGEIGPGHGNGIWEPFVHWAKLLRGRRWNVQVLRAWAGQYLCKPPRAMARTLSFTASTRLHFHRTCEVELSEKLSTGLADALPLAADALPFLLRPSLCCLRSHAGFQGSFLCQWAQVQVTHCMRGLGHGRCKVDGAPWESPSRPWWQQAEGLTLNMQKASKIIGWGEKWLPLPFQYQIGGRTRGRKACAKEVKMAAGKGLDKRGKSLESWLVILEKHLARPIHKINIVSGEQTNVLCSGLILYQSTCLGFGPGPQ